MNFAEHSDLKGRHAFLSASKHHWTGYEDEKLDASYRNSLMVQRGTDLHNFAAEAIRLGIKMPRTKKTIDNYINDALGFRMIPEQVLFYSYNAFGTADAISFKRNFLRIHDLKTGLTPTSMRQLEIYAAFFCLEYGEKPHELEIELRVYQNDEVKIHIPETETILDIMQKVVSFDQRIDLMKAEALG